MYVNAGGPTLPTTRGCSPATYKTCALYREIYSYGRRPIGFGGTPSQDHPLPDLPGLEPDFGSIPTAIMGLERLQCLKISKCRLQLRQNDLAVLTSLAKLSSLEMRKEEWSEDTERAPNSPYHTWDRLSKEVMNSLREKLPELIVQIDPIPREVYA